MGALTELLFELSSEERMEILGILKTEPLKLSHIAQRLEMTITEASRHLQRLSDTGLISKNVDSLYSVSPYGVFVLTLLSGVDLASENRSYFSDHLTSAIPTELLSRIGELRGGKPVTDAMTTLAYIPGMFLGAEEFVYSMNVSPIPLPDNILNPKKENRSILPSSIRVPEGFHLVEGVSRRSLPKVDVFLIVTDKEAVVSFPYINGTMDYRGFIGKDLTFRKWCLDLYNYFWNRAQPNLK